VADEISEAVSDDSLGAGTNINDALTAAAEYMSESAEETGRHAILILTDNEGLNEKNPDEAVIAKMLDANTVVNAIVVGKGRRPSKESPQTKIYQNPDFTPADVFTISEETGGEAIKADEAGKAFSRMIERIRTRYSIHFSMPETAKRGFHRVEVRLTPEALQRYPEAQLRYRRGYRVAQ
jgi:hypothetical protein